MAEGWGLISRALDGLAITRGCLGHIRAMYLLDDGVKVNAEMQSSTVDDVQEISQRIGHAHQVAGFHGLP